MYDIQNHKMRGIVISPKRMSEILCFQRRDVVMVEVVVRRSSTVLAITHILMEDLTIRRNPIIGGQNTISKMAATGRFLSQISHIWTYLQNR